MKKYLTLFLILIISTSFSQVPPPSQFPYNNRIIRKFVDFNDQFLNGNKLESMYLGTVYEYNIWNSPIILNLEESYSPPGCLRYYHEGIVQISLSVGNEYIDPLGNKSSIYSNTVYEHGSEYDDQLNPPNSFKFDISMSVEVTAISSLGLTPKIYNIDLSINSSINKVKDLKVLEDILRPNINSDACYTTFYVSKISFSTRLSNRLYSPNIYLELNSDTKLRIDAKKTSSPTDRITYVPFKASNLSSMASDNEYNLNNMNQVYFYNNPLTGYPTGYGIFEWDMIDGCNDSDPYMFQVQILKLENTFIANLASDPTGRDIYTTIDWNKALTLEVLPFRYGPNNRYNLKDYIPTEGSGYYIWRVRPIGNYYDGGLANPNNLGQWNEYAIYIGSNTTSVLYSADSLQKIYTNLYTIDLDNSKNYPLYYFNIDESLNWSHSRVFTEGKQGESQFSEVMQYFNSMLVPRQIQSKTNEQSGLILQQNVLDKQGRMALQSLPLYISRLGTIDVSNNPPSIHPENNIYSPSNLKYKKRVFPHLNINGEQRPYDYLCFDLGEGVSTGLVNPAPPNTVNNRGLLQEYYDGDNYLGGVNGNELNTLKNYTNIPDAEAFPYVRTIFSNDGLNTPIEQSLPGYTHRIKPISQLNDSKTIRKYFGSASKEEMTAFFGKEYPNPDNVLKEVSIDPNNIISYTFKNINGQVIATALNRRGVNEYSDLTTNLTNLNYTNGVGAVNLQNKYEYNDFAFIYNKLIINEGPIKIITPKTLSYQVKTSISPFNYNPTFCSSNGVINSEITSLFFYAFSPAHTTSIKFYNTDNQSFFTIPPSNTTENITLQQTNNTSPLSVSSPSFSGSVANAQGNLNLIASLEVKEADNLRNLIQGRVNDATNTIWGKYRLSEALNLIKSTKQSIANAQNVTQFNNALNYFTFTLDNYTTNVSSPATPTDIWAPLTTNFTGYSGKQYYQANILDCFNLTYTNINCEDDFFKSNGNFVYTNPDYLSSTTSNAFTNDIIDNISDYIVLQIKKRPTNNDNKKYYYLYYTDFSQVMETNNLKLKEREQKQKLEFIWNNNLNEQDNYLAIRSKVSNNLHFFFYQYNLPLTYEYGTFFYMPTFSAFQNDFQNRIHNAFRNIINNSCALNGKSNGTGEPLKVNVHQKVRSFVNNFANLVIRKSNQLDDAKGKVLNGSIGIDLIDCEINTFDLLLKDLSTAYIGKSSIKDQYINQPHLYYKDPFPCRISYNSNDYSVPNGYTADDCGLPEEFPASNDECNPNPNFQDKKLHAKLYAKFKWLVHDKMFKAATTSVVNGNKNKGKNPKNSSQEEIENRKVYGDFYKQYGIDETALDNLASGNHNALSQSQKDNLLLGVIKMSENVCPSLKAKFEAGIRNFFKEVIPKCYVEGDAIDATTNPSTTENPRIILLKDLEYLVALMIEDCKVNTKVDYTINSSGNIVISNLTTAKKKYLDAIAKGKNLSITRIQKPNAFHRLRSGVIIPQDLSSNQGQNCFFEANSTNHDRSYETLKLRAVEIASKLNVKLQELINNLPNSYADQMKDNTRFNNYSSIISYLQNTILTDSKYSYIKNYFEYNANLESNTRCDKDFVAPFDNHFRNFWYDEENRKFFEQDLKDYYNGKLDIHKLFDFEFGYQKYNFLPVYEDQSKIDIENISYKHHKMISPSQHDGRRHFHTIYRWFLLRNSTPLTKITHSFKANENTELVFFQNELFSHYRGVDNTSLNANYTLANNEGISFIHQNNFGKLVKGISINFNIDEVEKSKNISIPTLEFMPIFLGIKPGQGNLNCNNTSFVSLNYNYDFLDDYPSPSLNITNCNIVYQFEPEAIISKELENKIKCVDAQLDNLADQIVFKFSEFKEKATTDALDKANDYIKNIKNYASISANVTVGENLEQVTLYYYDKAGNLKRTVPPKGVDLVNTENDYPDHKFVTYYTYNSKGQIIKSDTPDETQFNKFVYSRLGNLKFSQSGRQNTQNALSYVKYDKQMRVTESGQFTINTLENSPGGAELFPLSLNNDMWVNAPLIDRIVNNRPTDPDYNRYFPDFNPQGNLTSSNVNIINTPNTVAPFTPIPKLWNIKRNFVIQTNYSDDARIPGFYGIPPRRTFLDGKKVNSQLRDEDGDLTSKGDQVITYYSYDMHGNVDFVVQDLPATNNGGTRLFALTGYEYDLISKKVKKVFYNYYQSDSYVQNYEYDSDSRLKQVRTSRYGYLWDEDSRYYYAPHGKLNRVELGHDRLQGLDYTYTIQGWLKAINNVNSGRTDATTMDPGLDAVPYLGKIYNTAIDAYSEVLNYFRYTEGGNTYSDFKTNKLPNILGNLHHKDFFANNQLNTVSDFRSLYNGNIASWQSDYNTSNPNPSMAEIDHVFQYDILNRLLTARGYERNTNINPDWNTIGNSLLSNYSYDRNSNITNLNRRDAYGADLDNLTYSYPAENNKLRRVQEGAAVTGARNDDIEDQSNVDNYTYDASGNLVGDVAETINNITWTPDGKVKSVKGTSYLYDASGNRVLKRTVGAPMPNGVLPFTYTIYARDANSQVMAIYNRNTTNFNDGDEPGVSNCITMRFIIPQADCIAEVTLCDGEYTIDEKGNIIILVPGGKQATSVACAPQLNPIIVGNQTVFPQYNGGDFSNAKPGVNVGNYNQGSPLAAASLSVTVNGTPTTGTSVTIRPNIAVANIGLMPKIAEWHIYGNGEQGRFSIKKPDNGANVYYLDNLPQSTIDKQFARILGSKEYEIKDHLGNVRVAFTDYKQPLNKITQQRGVAPFIVDERSVNDYYPYGMLIPERSWSSENYRYGYNGNELDNEIKGTGNQLNTEYRILDPRLGRWFSQDPIIQPWESPYSTFAGNPIAFSDPSGLDEGGGASGTAKPKSNKGDYYKNSDGELVKRTPTQTVEVVANKVDNVERTAVMSYFSTNYPDFYKLQDNLKNNIDYNAQYKNSQALYVNAGQNIAGTNYLGENDVLQLNDKGKLVKTYKAPRIGSIDSPGVGHDIRVTNFKAWYKRKYGIEYNYNVWTSTSLLLADWQLVAEELSIATSSWQPIDQRLQGGITGTLFGIFLLPKTLLVGGSMFSPLGNYNQIIIDYNISNTNNDGTKVNNNQTEIK